MNIDRYIENTKKKTAKAKLPALSTLSPIMPDGAAGIETFNNSFGEELDPKDINRVKSVVESESRAFMLDKGFEESDLKDVLNIEFIENENVFTITVHADLTISSLRELADSLYEVVHDYDEDAYFDISANNSISVELTMATNLTETLHNLDKKGFDKYCKNYEFEALYESAKSKLTTKDKTKLQKFLQTTDDPEEVNVFMKSLLTEDADDGQAPAAVDERVLDEIRDAYDTLHNSLNHLVGEANRSGNDTLRNSADLALGALDDFWGYIQEIGEDFTEQSRTVLKKSIDVQKYVNAFKENYATPEEFEDATDLEYKDYNIFDVVFDWILNDIGQDKENELIADDVAQEVTDLIMEQ